MPRGDRATAQAHRRWLDTLPIITGKSLTALAAELNIAPSTLTRPRKEGEHGSSTLHANTIAKIVQRFQVPPPPGDVGASPSARQLPLTTGEEAAPFTLDPEHPFAKVIDCLTTDRPDLKPWLLKARTMELAGYLADDVLLLDTANLRPQTGDCVAAIVHAWPHPSTTVIVREFQHSPPVDLLVTRSLTTRIASTIVLDHDRVKLLGVFLPHRLRLPT